jgi:hypothetical protein
MFQAQLGIRHLFIQNILSLFLEFHFWSLEEFKRNEVPKLKFTLCKNFFNNPCLKTFFHMHPKWCPIEQKDIQLKETQKGIQS